MTNGVSNQNIKRLFSWERQLLIPPNQWTSSQPDYYCNLHSWLRYLRCGMHFWHSPLFDLKNKLCLWVYSVLAPIRNRYIIELRGLPSCQIHRWTRSCLIFILSKSTKCSCLSLSRFIWPKNCTSCKYNSLKNRAIVLQTYYSSAEISSTPIEK